MQYQMQRELMKLDHISDWRIVCSWDDEVDRRWKLQLDELESLLSFELLEVFDYA